MAGFELARRGSVTELAREWRVVRYLPLYLAGIAAGAGIGLGVSIYSSSREAVEAYRGPVAALIVAPETVIPDAPALPSVALDPLPIDVAPVVPSAAVPPASPVTAVLPASTNPAASAPAAAAPVAAAPVAAQPVVPAAAAVPASQPAAQPVASSQPAAAAPAAPGFYVPAVSSAGPSVLEQQLFEGINAERAKAGLPAYTFDSGLAKVARTRSQQMADQDYFSHTDPNGRTMYTALLAYFGYRSYAWAGENLAMNNYGSSEAAQRAVISLMNSPTHRANLLADDFFRIGIGEVTTKDGRHIFTMVFLG